MGLFQPSGLPCGSSAPHVTSLESLPLQEFADKTYWAKTGLKIDAFVELHIEQGPHLEEENLDIGIVEAIAAPSMIRVEFTGKGGHGGGMPMLQR